MILLAAIGVSLPGGPVEFFKHEPRALALLAPACQLANNLQTAWVFEISRDAQGRSVLRETSRGADTAGTIETILE